MCIRDRKYLDLDELTPAVLNDMVKAVYVHAPDKSKGHREQQIDISYDLVGIDVYKRQDLLNIQ